MKTTDHRKTPQTTADHISDHPRTQENCRTHRRTRWDWHQNRRTTLYMYFSCYRSSNKHSTQTMP